MKNILLSIIAIVSACVLLAGCSIAGKKAADKSKDTTTGEVSEVSLKDELNTPFTANGVEMKITNVTASEAANEEGKDKQLVVFQIEAKNIGTQENGIGAIDFQLKTKEKVYEVTEEMEAFGGVLKPDETSKGKLYYLIEPGEKATELQYKPSDKVLKTWKLK
ncbi:DUF4352 domain-containing protein [Enterococcus faecium]|uniref:DUF4352 domain-containing protein n=1 Tax=Enterococcus faecium TaxID=1352 RepID=UPI0023B2352E|nr:DUF4352 domain-containing protein [Enterococcus faecium]